MKLVVCDTHDNLLFFTDRGKVYHLRGYDVPDTKKQAKGSPIVNLIEIENGERVTAILAVKDYERDFILLATRNGEIKKTPLKEFEEVRRNGKIAMRLDDGDQLIAARLATERDATSSSSRAKARPSASRSTTSARPAAPAAASAACGSPNGGYVVGVETLDDGDQLLDHHRARLRQAHAPRRVPASRAAAARA